MNRILPRLLPFMASALLGAGALISAQETINIDAQAPAKPFPHFWEQMFGSDAHPQRPGAGESQWSVIRKAIGEIRCPKSNRRSFDSGRFARPPLRMTEPDGYSWSPALAKPGRGTQVWWLFRGHKLKMIIALTTDH